MTGGFHVQNLSIHIGERCIVDDISFDLAPGEIVALAGASGAGKSMTAMTPFGLSAGVASGSVVLDGVELVGRPERELSRICAEKIGFVFQQPLTALTPHRTVKQHWFQCSKRLAFRGLKNGWRNIRIDFRVENGSVF